MSLVFRIHPERAEEAERSIAVAMGSPSPPVSEKVLLPKYTRASRRIYKRSRMKLVRSGLGFFCLVGWLVGWLVLFWFFWLGWVFCFVLIKLNKYRHLKCKCISWEEL